MYVYRLCDTAKLTARFSDKPHRAAMMDHRRENAKRGFMHAENERAKNIFGKCRAGKIDGGKCLRIVRIS